MVDRWVLEEPGGLSPETEFSATEPDKHTNTHTHTHTHTYTSIVPVGPLKQ